MKKHDDSSATLNAKRQEIQPLSRVISSGDAALALDISQATLERLVTDGRITKVSHGTFDIIQLFREFVAYKGGIGARSEVEKQKAIKLSRENREANRKLIPVSTFSEDITTMFSTFQIWLKALPGRIASTGANTEPAVLRELVRVECARVKDDLGSIVAGRPEDLDLELGEDVEADTHPGRMGSAN